MTELEKIYYATWLSRVGVLQSGAIRQSCIASCSVLTAVLRNVGILAKPLCVSVAAMTEGWYKRLNAGERPTPEELDEWWEKDRAWSLGVAYDPTPNEGAFTGHMTVLAHRTYLCDPSLDQLARPERDLPLEPMAIPIAQAQGDLNRFLEGEEQIIAHFTDDEGNYPMLLVYSHFKDDITVFNAPDWAYRDERYGNVVEGVTKMIQHLEYVGATGDSLPKLPDLPDAPSDPSLLANVRDEAYRRRVKLVDR